MYDMLRFHRSAWYGSALATEGNIGDQHDQCSADRGMQRACARLVGSEESVGALSVGLCGDVHDPLCEVLVLSLWTDLQSACSQHRSSANCALTSTAAPT